MATQSVHKDKYGPVWPLGLIVVVTPGTPVNIMSLVDAAKANAPETAVTFGPSANAEYTERAWKITFTACKAGASHGLVANTGNIYIMKPGAQGAGNRDDYGSMVAVMTQGAATAGEFPEVVLDSAALNRNTLSPYEFLIDADNAGDSCLVTLSIQ